MNHRNPPPSPPPPPPPPYIRLTTTAQIIKQTTSLFCSHLLTFLFLSTLLLTFRSNVHSASHYLSSLIDRDPSLKLLLSRIDDAARIGGGSGHHHHHRHRRRGGFLHVSRVGTLDDDFFSGGSNFDRSLFGPSSTKSLPNSTLLILSDFSPSYGFSGSVIDNGISFPAIVKPGDFSFKAGFEKNATVLDQDGIKSAESSSRLDDPNAVLDLDFLMKGFELGRRDATSLFFLAGILSAAYAYVVFAFIVTYTWANGVVFLKVVDHLLGNYRSFFRTFWDGSNVGLRRLSGFVLMKWAVRDALAQLMGIYFFGEIEDQYMFFKVFLRMKFMPFANLAPWVKGHELDSAGFIVMWFLSDLLVGLLFSVDSWVAIVDSRRGGREIVKEGCRILTALFGPAFEIRWFEAIICGSVGRWMLRRVFGEVFTLCLQSLMEIYFMVAWLIFYFAARQKDDAALGRTFGRRELEGLLDIAR
ncbi:ubiquitin-specific protease 13 [Striga asiatica]|uniref:Ubiquitin-specific protease 13 n=1 Tax=Striga asiatica TaxID=4170 RepID=A0A5A7RA27_STRAF|nr:ubiquitin-specific protease 13 [Striga asiatica]